MKKFILHKKLPDWVLPFFLLSILFMLVTSCKKRVNTRPFVKVSGAHFKIGNQRYHFIGANFWQGAYLGANIIPDGKKRLIRDLNEMKKYGITNLRILASSEKCSIKPSLTPAFQTKPGVYNKKLLKGLDFLLAQMRKRNMHAVVILNNYWDWSGGMPQYVNWSTGKKIPNALKTGDWNKFMTYSASFYGNSLANRMYRNYIRHVITRTNTVTGTKYYNDPTIMAWELANEPRPNPNSIKDTTLLPSFYHWIKNTAEYIHKLAPHQLVTTGSEGLAGTLQKKNIFIHEQEPASINYITIHIWPKNWGWYKAKKAKTTFKPAVKKTFNYLDEHIKFAQELHKPLVVEEFGLPRDNGKFSRKTPVTYRNNYYHMIFDTLVTDVKKGSPLSGANFWAYGGEGRAHTSNYSWKAGTDFTGDPPQEAQGLNSVFNTDTTTLDIVRKYAAELR